MAYDEQMAYDGQMVYDELMTCVARIYYDEQKH